MTPAPPRKITPLWKRLPFVVVGVVGLWFWQGGGGVVSTEHTIVWKVPGAYATVKKVEAQLWEGDELLTRFELETPAGLSMDPERALTLKRGKYRSELLVWRDVAAAPEIRRTSVEVAGEKVVVVR